MLVIQLQFKCIYVHMYACLSICLFFLYVLMVCTYVYIKLYACVYTFTLIYLFACICTCLHLCLCYCHKSNVHARMHTYMYTYTRDLCSSCRPQNMMQKHLSVKFKDWRKLHVNQCHRDTLTLPILMPDRYVCIYSYSHNPCRMPIHVYIYTNTIMKFY